MDSALLLRDYSDAVQSAPARLGLTSAGDRTDFFNRHVQDAVTLGAVLPTEWTQSPMKVIDVGTGNGVPGIVLGILFPHWRVTLLDSDSKKSGFLEVFCNSRHINNIEIACVRAETYGRGAGREQFDVSIARALGPLGISLELLAPFVKVGGTAIVSRGTSAAEEAFRANVAKELGLVFEKHRSYQVDKHKYVASFFRKREQIPPKFPRPVGNAVKYPL